MLGKFSQALWVVPIFEDRNSGSTMEVPGSEGLEGGAGYGQCAASLPTGKTVLETYGTNVLQCWHDYEVQMDSIKKDWCDWALISR